MEVKPAVAIDFDRVLHDCDHPIPGRRMGPPIEGAKAALQRYRDLGYDLCIHSCNREEVIQAWMAYYDIPYDYIWVQKPIAKIYLDDKARRFTGWDDPEQYLVEATGP
jgi:hypothetical protein